MTEDDGLQLSDTNVRSGPQKMQATVELRNRLVAGTERVVELARAGESVDAETVEYLLRLERLIALHGRNHIVSSRFDRWLIIGLSCVILAVVAFLADTKKAVSASHLQVTTDLVRFTVARDTHVGDGIALRQLLAAGLSEIIDEDTGARVANSAMRLTSPGKDGDGIWLAPVAVERGATIELRREAKTGRARVRISQPHEMALTISYSRPITVAGKDDGAPHGADPPAVVTVRAPQALDLTMRPMDESACFLCVPIPISQISFQDEDVWHRGTDIVNDGYSPLRSAEVRFDDIPGKTVRIGQRELLNVAIRNGTIRRVSDAPTGGIVLEMDGDIVSLTTGSSDRPHDLRPSRLAWLLSSERTVAIWSGVVYLCGLLVALGRWWGLKV